MTVHAESVVSERQLASEYIEYLAPLSNNLFTIAPALLFSEINPGPSCVRFRSEMARTPQGRKRLRREARRQHRVATSVTSCQSGPMERAFSSRGDTTQTHTSLATPSAAAKICMSSRIPESVPRKPRCHAKGTSYCHSSVASHIKKIYKRTSMGFAT